MKYIKKFENNNIEYQEGDYVLLDTDKIIKNLKKNENSPDDKYSMIKYRLNNFEGYDYAVIFFNSEYNTTYEVTQDEIIRLMTLDEIDIFDEKKKLFNIQNKYNL